MVSFFLLGASLSDHPQVLIGLLGPQTFIHINLRLRFIFTWCIDLALGGWVYLLVHLMYA